MVIRRQRKPGHPGLHSPWKITENPRGVRHENFIAGVIGAFLLVAFALLVWLAFNDTPWFPVYGGDL
jgi:hypothetical protein